MLIVQKRLINYFDTMDSQHDNLYLADFGQAGAYTFRAPDKDDAAVRLGDVNNLLRQYVEARWPGYDFNVLSRARVQAIPAGEAGRYAGYRTLDAVALQGLYADVLREAASGADTHTLNNGSPWADM